MLKQSLALGALAVSLISGTPTQATSETLHPSTSIAAGVPARLVYMVEAAGVPVLDGRNYPDFCGQHDGAVLGAYFPGYNKMLMCIQNFDSNELYVEVFAHEAVHLAQDCRAGIENGAIYAGESDYTADLWRDLPDFKKENILEKYPEEAYTAEIEAFFFEDYPEAVADGVAAACF